jgi:hypothetical protein
VALGCATLFAVFWACRLAPTLGDRTQNRAKCQAYQRVPIESDFWGSPKLPLLLPQRSHEGHMMDTGRDVKGTSCVRLGLHHPTEPTHYNSLKFL